MNAICSISSTPSNAAHRYPCHHIPLNEAGETIEDLEESENQAKLERKVSEWLRAKINELEEERATQAIAGALKSIPMV
jgi:hypothetical protein